ncbi:MAG: L-histidine N(alpha)-methyltransferase [Acidobacteria bacterium]|nr:L-histidine N(alpha)-methyltransferase [Acidobacteriota bacterium]
MSARAIPALSAVAEEAWRGLRAEPKRLPAWLFYDDAGSALFQEITRLPEYYLTRTELGIFKQHGAEIMAAAGSGSGAGPLILTELGAGSAEKTGVLIGCALQQAAAVVYEPVDVSTGALKGATARLRKRWPQLRLKPVIADYTNGFRLPGRDGGARRVVLWIGSSIGNFERADAARILGKVRRRLQPGDALLLGADLGPSRSKQAAAIVAAYNDRAGVTARFNRNLLARLNRELEADFEDSGFRHIAEWNAAESRIEIYLESRRRQEVALRSLGLTVRFAAGERMHTENSHKYRPGELEGMLGEAGFTVMQTWHDPRRWFAVIFGKAE